VNIHTIRKIYMHTYVYPISSAINRGKSLHLCKFFVCVQKSHSYFVVLSGTLVLDEEGFYIINCENVPAGVKLMPQKLHWIKSFSEDELINKWIKKIQSEFSEGEFRMLCGSSNRVKYLEHSVKELMKTGEKFIFIKDAILFKSVLKCGRIVWSRSLGLLQD
jgi:hypothetical protein